MRSLRSAPLHVRLVAVNGVVFLLGLLTMSLAPDEHRLEAALLSLVLGGISIVAVNTRHLRHSLAPILASVGSLRKRFESEDHARAARSLAKGESDAQQIAAALHDDVQARLTAALVGLKKTIAHAPPDIAMELESVQHDARLAYVGLRRAGRRLRPEVLEDLGLHGALLELVKEFTANNRGVKVRTRLDGPFPGIDEEAGLVLYRVAEQALDNAAKHASAKRVDLGLERTDEAVVLTVRDDGVGIGTNDERTGILSMRERAALRGGGLHVSARSTGGTEVRLEVPSGPPDRTLPADEDSTDVYDEGAPLDG